jgi:hypothetical protein
MAMRDEPKAYLKCQTMQGIVVFPLVRGYCWPCYLRLSGRLVMNAAVVLAPGRIEVAPVPSGKPVRDLALVVGIPCAVFCWVLRCGSIRELV